MADLLKSFTLIRNGSKTLKLAVAQNIDTLEEDAGISAEKVVKVFGSVKSSACIKCHKSYGFDWMKAQVNSGGTPICSDCSTDQKIRVVKPDIVFSGEDLPESYFLTSVQDFPKCDLLIILGTSLANHPFVTLVDRVGANVPRLLINSKDAVNPDDSLPVLKRVLNQFNKKHAPVGFSSSRNPR